MSFRPLRYAVRRLAGSKASTSTIVLTVALGIGGTTAAFSVVHGVLLEPLPYDDPHELVEVYTGWPDGREWGVSAADYLALADEQESFTSVAAYDDLRVTLSGKGEPEQIRVLAVTASFFPTLQLRPTLGRTFGPEEDTPGAASLAVVSHAFWRDRLGMGADVVGSSITLDEEPHAIVGVLAPSDGPVEHEYGVIRNLRMAPPSRKGPFRYDVLARLDAGVSVAGAMREIAAIEDRLFPVWRDSWPSAESTWEIRPLKDSVVGEAGHSTLIALGAVALLLLIACANAAGLLVARSLRHRPELAVRAALGASRARIMGELMTESAILAGLGALLGFAVAIVGVRLATTMGVGFIPRIHEIGFDGPVLSFMVLVTLSSFLLFGLVPAVQSSGGGLGRALASGARGGGSGIRARHLRRLLVGAEFAVTAPLLIGTVLLLMSLGNLFEVDPGYDSDRLLTAYVTLPPSYYADPQPRRVFWSELGRRLAARPEVEMVATSNARPPADPGFGNNFLLEDRPLGPGETQPSVPWVIAPPAYFELLDLRLLDGRMFEASDDGLIAIVDETWAQRFYPGESAVGRRFRQGGCTRPDCDAWEVIGVVEDVTYTGLAATGEGTMYLNGIQFSSSENFVIVRTATMDPLSALPALREVVLELDPTTPIADVASGRELVHASLREPRYLTVLIGGFAGVALLLALVGIYGIMVHFVQEHRRGIGVRLALGGTRHSIITLVLGSGIRPVLAGTIVGAAVALVLMRFLSSVLFGVGAADPRAFGGVALGLLVLALAASYVPARRAAAVDPATLLREG